MELVSLDALSRMAGVPVNDNMRSVAIAINKYGPKLGLFPHRLAHYLAQLMHEGGRFVYDREVWGPTEAQKRYDTRTDLGNTPERDGDGELYKGRTAIQITGKSNYRQFRDWCAAQGFNPPDFVANPDLVNTDPWEGLGPLWYWSTRKINALADANDIEQITKRINGGRNGLADRINMYERAAMVLNGFRFDNTDSVKAAQRIMAAEGHYVGPIDGDIGPKTRGALHLRLSKMPTATSAPKPAVKPAPVVTEDPVPVVPKGADKRKGTWVATAIAGIGAPFATFASLDTAGKIIVMAFIVGALVFIIWRGELIVRRVKKIVRELG